MIKIRRLTACLLIIGLLVLPAALSAKAKRGATLVVTRADGTQVMGELIAVKTDSLLLLSGGRDISVPHAGIGSVRIVRRAPLGFLTVAGFLLGSGVVGMATERLDEWDWAHAWLAGIGGSIAGLVSGLVTAKDAAIDWRKEPGGAPAYVLERLRNLSREGRSGTGPGPARLTRFRITLATTMTFDDRWRQSTGEFAWRFTEAVPPEEAGPYSSLFMFTHNPGEELASPGPLSLGWAWTERWGAEVELSLCRKSSPYNASVYPEFVSTVDGLLYGAQIHDRQRAGYGQLLVGLVYRPVVPSARRKKTLEIGASAGPAWIEVTSMEGILPVGRKTVPAGQVRISYDHDLTPVFFLGVYGAYQWSVARFAEATSTRVLEFTHWESGGDPVESITRSVEMVFPAREYSRTGLVCGLRIGFRL